MKEPQKRRRGPGRPFVKGASGNPRGRPKELEQVKAAAREYTIEAIERLVFWMRSDEGRASIMAADKLLDRAWGKAAQDVNVALNDDLDRISDVQLFREIAELRTKIAAADGGGREATPNPRQLN